MTRVGIRGDTEHEAAWQRLLDRTGGDRHDALTLLLVESGMDPDRAYQAVVGQNGSKSRKERKREQPNR